MRALITAGPNVSKKKPGAKRRAESVENCVSRFLRIDYGIVLVVAAVAAVAVVAAAIAAVAAALVTAALVAATLAALEELLSSLE
ncbi:MAG: hypothetical protein KGJ78_12455, partial [Alphaproteobacteria bacterium]|nr:hypothetical protein [Alphaproteobacteria bacterium]